MTRTSTPRIVDFSTHLSGPLASQLLAEMGADVVKVEPPRVGDGNRGLEPFIGGRGMFHLATSSGTRSLEISTRSPHWGSVVAAAAQWADAVIVGTRPADAVARKLDFASMAELNPRLVYCLISGFGESGPWKDYLAHGQTIDALAGAVHLQWEDGLPTTAPGWRSAGAPLAGVFGALGVMSGLARQEREGCPQHVSISLWASALWWQWRDANCLVNLGEPWQEYRDLGSRYSMYPTSDRRAILVAPIEEKFWKRFCNLLELPAEWIERGSWAKSGMEFGRGGGHADEKAVIAAAMRSRPLAEWWQLLSNAEVPFAPVLTLEEALTSDHAEAERIMSRTTVGETSAQMVSSPIRFADEADRTLSSPPELGQDSASVLADFGLSPSLARDLVP
ncbi:MAG TPA: CaiB/BaiF CoA-transferase family protein [Acidimicrobiales bacterium]|jgi:crotonobetainyl-CoA:carnitine CoA-transferase CaiB-like acyl-CoA transferase